jgi:hypothetical protein
VDSAPQDHRIAGEGARCFAADPWLRGTPTPAGLRVPDPQFPSRVPARRLPSHPGPPSAPAPVVTGAGAGARQQAPSNRVDRSSAPRSSVEQLRWARCPDNGRLHLLHPAGVTLAAAGDHAQAVCGHRILAEGLTINGDSTGALCMACVIGVST